MKKHFVPMAALLCAASLTAAALAGCSQTAASTAASSSPAAGSSSVASAAAAPDASSSQTYLKVTALDGSTVTAEYGTLTGQAPDGQGGTPPDQNRAASSGAVDSAAGTPPAKPEGDGAGSAPAGSGTPPQGGGVSSGSAPADGTAPSGGPGGTFAGNGQTVAFTMTDSTVITVESMQGSKAGTAADVTVGAILSVTLDGSGQATAVTVKSMDGGAAPDGSAPDAATSAEKTA